jgi:integrase
MRRVPKRKPAGQRVIDTFTPTEIAMLVDLPVQDGALMAILLYAGLRKAEARNLRRRDVQLERGQIVVYDGKGGKDRAIVLHEIVAQAMADSKPGGGDVIDRSRPIGEGTFHRWYGRCLEAAGVQYRHPHTTRHTFATEWLRAGGRLSTLKGQMGHASIKTTSDLYEHLDLSDARVDMALMGVA